MGHPLRDATSGCNIETHGYVLARRLPDHVTVLLLRTYHGILRAHQKGNIRKEARRYGWELIGSTDCTVTLFTTYIRYK